MDDSRKPKPQIEEKDSDKSKKKVISLPSAPQVDLTLVYANLLSFSLVYIRQKMASGDKNLIFKKYSDLSVSSTQISKLNSLIQANRDRLSLLEPLFNVLLAVDVTPDDYQPLCDILNIVRQGLYNYCPTDHPGLVRTLGRVLKRLKKVHQPARELAKELI